MSEEVPVKRGFIGGQQLKIVHDFLDDERKFQSGKIMISARHNCSFNVILQLV